MGNSYEIHSLLVTFNNILHMSLLKLSNIILNQNKMRLVGHIDKILIMMNYYLHIPLQLCSLHPAWNPDRIGGYEYHQHSSNSTP